MSLIEGKTTKLTGKISMSRVHGSEDYIQIRMKDSTSHCIILEARIELAEFTNLLTNRQTEAVIELFNSENLGKTLEHKQVEIFVPEKINGHSDYGKKQLARMLSPEFNDGWYGRVEDAYNHYKRCKSGNVGDVKGSWYNVSFHRWV